MSGRERAAALFVPLCLAACLLLGGCAFTGTDAATLYRLPRLPAEYESLESLIDELLAEGAEYTAPSSGSNLQSVQMVDLNGDGEEEAVAFLRKPNDERPMKIYVFCAADENYERFCMIEGTSNSIYSITYTDIDGDGWRELLVGIRGDLDVQNLAIYSLESGEPKQLLLTGYSRYVTRDMDGDGQQELVVLRSDEESFVTADYYAWNGAELQMFSSLRLSSTIAELSRMTVGKLAGGANALFVTGVAEDSIAITDILTVRDRTLQTVTRGGALGTAGEVFRFLGLFPSDIDGDGVTEVPEPVAFAQADPDDPVFYRICWRQYDEAGETEVVLETFQDTQDGWSLVLPERWGDRVTVSRVGGTESGAVTFSLLTSGAPEPFLTIQTFTGAARYSPRSGVFLLVRQAELVCTAELTDAAHGLIDEQILRENFSLITAEWTTGEN